MQIGFQTRPWTGGVRIAFFLSFIVSVFVRSFVDLGVSFSLLIGFLALMFSVLARWLGRVVLVVSAAISAAAFLAFIRVDIASAWSDANRVPCLGQVVEVRGNAEAFSESQFGRNLLVRKAALICEGAVHKLGQNIMVATSKVDTFSEEGSVVLNGKIDLISPSSWLAEYSLDKSKDVGLTMNFPKIISAPDGGGAPPSSVLRARIISILRAAIFFPGSELAAGLLLGEDSGLKFEKENFNRAGLTHALAFSGYNLSIVSEAVFASLLFFPLVVRVVSAGLLVIGLTVLSSGGASAIRALIMALVVLSSRVTGRLYSVSDALFLAIFFMLLHKPSLLVYDLSFQLSVLATAGLVYVSPVFGYLLPKREGWQGSIREILITTLSAQVAVLPLILFKIGLLSLVAPVSNILFLPLVPLAMFLSFLVVIVGFVSIYGSMVVGLIASPVLWGMLKIAELLGSMKYAAVAYSIGLSSLAISYALIVVAVLFFSGRTRRQKDLPPAMTQGPGISEEASRYTIIVDSA